MADEEDNASPPPPATGSTEIIVSKDEAPGLADVVPLLIRQRPEDLANPASVTMLAAVYVQEKLEKQTARADLEGSRKALSIQQADTHEKDKQIIRLEERVRTLTDHVTRNSILMLLAGTSYGALWSSLSVEFKAFAVVVGTVLALLTVPSWRRKEPDR